MSQSEPSPQADNESLTVDVVEYQGEARVALALPNGAIVLMRTQAAAELARALASAARDTMTAKIGEGDGHMANSPIVLPH